MTTFDRSKFKGQKISSLKDQAAVEQALSKGGNRPMHELQSGQNVVRWYPAHPGDSDLFMLPISVWYMPHYKDDSGGKKKLAKKRIFNATIHSSHGRDIVAEYIRLATREGSVIYQDEDDLKQYLKHIHGHGNGSSYIGGLSGPIRMVGYCEFFLAGKKQGVKKIEVPMLVKNKMNELAVTGTDDDDPDPFSDPDNGMVTVIVKDVKQKKPQDKYKVAYKMPIQKALMPLTDAELTHFMTLDSLAKLYINSYTLSDFEYALEGLRIFDKQHGYGVFDMEEFGEVAEEIRVLCSESSSEDDVDNSKVQMMDSNTAFDGDEDGHEDFDEDEDESGFDREALTKQLMKLKVNELKSLYKEENPKAKTYKSDTKPKLVDQIIDEREIVYNEENDISNATGEKKDQAPDLSDIKDDLPF